MSQNKNDFQQLESDALDITEVAKKTVETLQDTLKGLGGISMDSINISDVFSSMTKEEKSRVEKMTGQPFDKMVEVVKNIIK